MVEKDTVVVVVGEGAEEEGGRGERDGGGRRGGRNGGGRGGGRGGRGHPGPRPNILTTKVSYVDNKLTVAKQ